MQSGEIGCPLPEVAKALRPYIHSRSETARIRRAINVSLQESEVPLSSIGLLSADTAPSTRILDNCAGVRKAYAAALRAHKVAQSKLAGVQQEIELLRDEANGVEQGRRALETQTAVKESIDLLRQNQRRRKLQIVNHALQAIEAENKSRPSLQNRLRELTPVHSQAPPQQKQSQDQDLQIQLLRLKKEIIICQRDLRSVGAKSASTAHEDGVSHTSADVRTRALRRARDELIGLIEAELAKMPEGEEEEISEPDEARRTETFPRSDTVQDNVQKLYDEYVEARKAIVAAVNAQPADPSPVLESDLPPTKSAVQATKPADVSLAVQILPYVSELRALSEAEQGLVEQSSYLRRQIAHSSTNIQQAILRLSDESLLVAPGAARTGVWVEAAEEARREDADMLRARLQAGEESLGSARATIERLHRLTDGS